MYFYIFFLVYLSITCQLYNMYTSEEQIVDSEFLSSCHKHER